jgi:hypothetical protein
MALAYVFVVMVAIVVDAPMSCADSTLLLAEGRVVFVGHLAE